ncbi:NADH-ubiquinone oxidoreductase-F iron-sulfur binding region domain-containing protein [Actinacidiphila oryziradicis]|uniref:NADH-quinone oxidoreductase subunit E n=1 Tax=Actinacidiphila oryziradicis TaxID=2571141 RepID=A0A4U0S9Q1_9ACTN|nr:NADH-ubiquinone oxidoreductase-F iron-sulfur binding region domain-containing protein [Actinacidiphila oryziradicis]TKA04947.1 NADH-quinone oxidoreductase subunit E [Actinacidiphila oryziradicis]
MPAISTTRTTSSRPADAAAPFRLLPPPGTGPVGLSAHIARYGVPPYGSPQHVVTEVRDAGLAGHGGAAFPTHRKLISVAEAGRRTGRTPVAVANGAEGEPASFKDKTLLRDAPHLVLDGLQLAAEAVGAGEAHLAIEAGTGLRAPLTAAIAKRAEHGADLLPVRLTEVPRRFLSGQSSALAEHLSGRPALPRYQRPPVRERGVGRAPTLVQNAETLAHLALIARYGAAWFRSAGTEDEPGSMLCTVHAAGHRPWVTEAAFGTPLRQLVPLDSGVQAVLVGGYHGIWIPAGQAAGLRLSAADLGSPGAGVLAALPADRCGLVETARVLRYLALQSAGQCGPCLNGLPRIAAAFSTLAERGPGGDAVRDDIARWAGLVEGRGACHHPDGTVRLVRSALTVFAGEIDEHGRGYCRGAGGAPLLPVPAEEY